MARGHTNAELAGQLHLSEATVKTHVARILGKLGLRDRVQAVIVACETGLVGPSGPEPGSLPREGPTRLTLHNVHYRIWSRTSSDR